MRRSMLSSVASAIPSACLALALHAVDRKDPKATAIARAVIRRLATLPFTGELRSELATAFGTRR